jgi:peptidoglycan/xylan/chitin deacetylase (PgdA/CDA1 family)
LGAGFYDVTAENFRAQMDYLKTNGYAITIVETEGSAQPQVLAKAKQNGEGLRLRHSSCSVGAPDAGSGVAEPYVPARNVILTFDDGEMNNFEEAFPVLQEFGFPGYFFIIAQRVGRHGYMGWEHLHALHEAGMVIGSHGFSHEILTNLQETQIQEELAASKKYLERNLEIPVESLSIPRGFCNDKILQMAYNAGYKNVFISERPAGLKFACLSRVAVKSRWSLRRFIHALDGQTPAGDRIFDFLKNGFKRIGGGALYDWMRRTLLNIE